MITIEELIHNGRFNLNQARLADEAERETDAQATQEAIDKIAAGVWVYVKTIIPEILLQFTGLCSEIDPTRSSNNLYYRIDGVPGCTPITFVIEWSHKHTGEEGWKYIPELKRNHYNEYGPNHDGAFIVSCLDVVRRNDENDILIEYVVAESGAKYSNDLAVALALAADEHDKRFAMQEEADRRTVEMLKKRAKHEAEKAAIIAAERNEIDRLLAALRVDPVAVNLLKAYLAISAERESLRQTIAELNDSMESQEHYHSEAMGRASRKIEESEGKARDAQREAEDARREAEDAEAKLKKAKRGGW